jgi:hypothetical protein
LIYCIVCSLLFYSDIITNLAIIDGATAQQ